ncbi:MAG: phosphate signaling complex protein PhoU [Gemmatimonadetes bacterium]|nr:phosphate signaling complex protein PhoU [Gemmatimonadota bacterium]
METHLQQQLEGLRSALLSMAALVEEQIARAVTAFMERDVDLCDQVIAGDGPIDAMELEIDEQCIRLLALQHPIARDLRFVAASMKITIDLERLGDIAVNISKKTKQLTGLPNLKPLVDLPRMADLSQSMVKDSLNAFVRGDEQLAMDVCDRDEEVNQLQDQIFEELLAFMKEDSGSVPQAMQLIFISRHIERLADHATNIAEGVVYFSQGRVIKHHAVEDPTPSPIRPESGGPA